MKTQKFLGLFVNRLIDKLGYEVKPKLNRLSIDEVNDSFEFAHFVRIINKNTMVARVGLASLYEQAVYCEHHGIYGAFVECGVWKGGAVGLMALVNQKHSSVRRHIHLFDAFQDICEPDETIDGERALREVRSWAISAGTKGRLVPMQGFYAHKGGPGTLMENQRLLETLIGYDPNHLHYHSGWFQSTLPRVANSINEIAILRLDADWYASTKICLNYLFDKVVKGGFVIFDDYGTYDGCRKAVNEFLAKKEKPFFLNYVNQDIRYIIMS